MSTTAITVIRLIFAAILPVAASAAFCFAEKKTGFGKMNNFARQVIIGIVFGIIAILATENGIKIEGAVINARNASPLSAGLIFGGPAGIIAGIIGGVERFFSDAGDYTRIACSATTIAAGFLGAIVRKYLLENKNATWFYGLCVGATSEVLHMLMIFITNIGDMQRAFEVVESCTVIMIVTNSLSVMFSIIAATIIRKKNIEILPKEKKKEKIAQTFQRWLIICVVLGFVITMLFSRDLLTRIAYQDANSTLSNALEDVENDIIDVSNRNLLGIARKVKEKVHTGTDHRKLLEYAEEYELSEINIIDENGIISASTDKESVGFNMASGEQSAEFLVLLGDVEEYVQDFQPKTKSDDVYCKYAGVAIKGGFVQVGYDTALFHESISEQVRYAAQNRSIGRDGWIIVCDMEGTIVSDKYGHEGENVSIIENFGYRSLRPGKSYNAEIFGVPAIIMFTETEGYYIIAVMSEEEAYFSKDVSVYMLAFMELLVFASLFTVIFVLIKRIIVDSVGKVNKSLARITEGDLSVKVDVRGSEEFNSLSDDINSTVATLKRYIDDAQARFDKDLEIAKKIQHSALPSVFPPYPNRRDFSIFASMDAAKEVGGDFYDFYLIDENHLAFLVADVSGKGIPGAMFMMTSKTLIKSHAESGLPVNEVFTEVNKKLCESNEAEMFVTAWMGVLNLETGLLRFANAGHNPPVIKRKDGDYEYIKCRANFVLAGMENIRYTEQKIQLAPGDEIYLYTDGVTEAHNAKKELFGEERLLQSLNGVRGLDVSALCKKVKSDVDTFVGEAEQFDDITMLCVRLGTEENEMISVAPTIESVAEVTENLESTLEKIGIPRKLTVKILVSFDEIYSNIVHYSGATEAHINIVKTQNSIRIVFRDNGKPYNPLSAKDPDITASVEERGIGGLGIYMVKKMSDDVSYEYSHGMNKLTLTNNL